MELILEPILHFIFEGLIRLGFSKFEKKRFYYAQQKIIRSVLHEKKYYKYQNVKKYDSTIGNSYIEEFSLEIIASVDGIFLLPYRIEQKKTVPCCPYIITEKNLAKSLMQYQTVFRKSNPFRKLKSLPGGVDIYFDNNIYLRFKQLSSEEYTQLLAIFDMPVFASSTAPSSSIQPQ